MKGHPPLIAMRMRRRKPFAVSIDIGAYSWAAIHWHEWADAIPHVLIEPSDPIDRLDLRFLVGLHVDVSGDVSESDRVKAVFAACERAGAQRVVGAIHQPRGEEIEILEYLDSKGALQKWLP